MTTELGDLVFLVETLANVERFDEARDYLQKFVSLKPALDRAQYLLFEKVYKMAIRPIRNSLRMFSEYDGSDVAGMNAAKLELVRKYEEQSRKDLNGLCDEAISLTMSLLLPHAVDSRARVFFLKSLGDYYRYIIEFEKGEAHAEAVAAAGKHYRNAIEISDSELLKSDPMRLGAILNYAIFLFEHVKNTSEAVDMLQMARKDAEIDLPKLSSDDQKESLDIIQAMMTNLIVWYDGEEQNR